MSEAQIKNEKKVNKSMRAIDYIREYSIEQRLTEYIGQVVHERPEDPFGVIATLFSSQSKPATIFQLKGDEVLLSTGRPSLKVDVYANYLGRTNLVGSATAPIGISMFTQETRIMVDETSTRFSGLGCKNACQLVDIVSASLKGQEFTTIDHLDILVKRALDGKTNIANVLSSISFALAIASAEIFQQPLFMYLYESFFPQQAADHFSIPTPIVTLLEGGMHAQSSLAFESIMIIPKVTLSYNEQIRTCSEVSEKLYSRLHGTDQIVQVGKTGGLICDSAVIESAISLVEKAISDAGYSPETDFTIGIDCAATYFYDSNSQKYQIEKGVSKSAAELVQFYIDLITQHKSITFINDGVSEIDHAGWELMRDALMSRLKVFGGDIYASQSNIARRGLKKKWTDGILIQMSQASTLSDAAETAKLFKQRGKQVCIGRRAGETCETLLCDFGVAVQAEYFMAGGLFGAEGTSKYNRMLQIHEYLRDRSLLQ